MKQNQKDESNLARIDSLGNSYNAIITELEKSGWCMARPKNRSEGHSLTLTLPRDTFNYLVHLATAGKLGLTENEVAAHIIIREVVSMQRDGFHQIKLP